MAPSLVHVELMHRSPRVALMLERCRLGCTTQFGQDIVDRCLALRQTVLKPWGLSSVDDPWYVWHFFPASVRLVLHLLRGVPARRRWEIFQINQAVTRQHQQGR